MPPDTKDLILKTANKLFVKKGFTATSMREIAEMVGIGKATIYHHFPDKETILLALFSGSLERMDASVEAIRGETRPLERISVAVSESLRFLFEFGDIVQIVRRELPGGREEMRTKYAGQLKEYLALLSDAVREGTAQGLFRDVQPTETARVLMTMIQGTFAMTMLGGGRSESPERAAQTILDIFFHGIEAL